jgi:hypothetical protein
MSHIPDEFGWDDVGYRDGWYEAEATCEVINAMAAEIERLRERQVPEGWECLALHRTQADDLLQVHYSCDAYYQLHETIPRKVEGWRYWRTNMIGTNGPFETCAEAIAAAEEASSDT